MVVDTWKSTDSTGKHWAEKRRADKGLSKLRITVTDFAYKLTMMLSVNTQGVVAATTLLVGFKDSSF